MVEGLKPVHRAALLREFGTAENVFRKSEMEICAIPEIKAEAAYRICHFDLRQSEEEMAKAKRAGIRIIDRESESYPAIMQTIPDPPCVLYMRGEVKRSESTVALVGSRKATPYGLNAAQYLARDLAAAGVTVVSGLARGIDARAHSAALEAGGRTIAVLGSGVDVIYPAEHRSLAARIAEQGAVISEFPLGTPPDRENFPVRNRIISGLSFGIVVVEASQKSGSLITARMAAEQGREVMAVPGSIFSESSQGCLALLKDGASLVRNWKDVVAELPAEEFGTLRKQDEREEVRLTDLEKNIVEVLSFEHPKHVDQIAELVSGITRDILAALVSLELKNYITQLPGKNFIRAK